MLLFMNSLAKVSKKMICYLAGHYERPPYNESDIRSIYHVREYDVFKLMQIKEPIDLFISHDWPLGITDFGDSDNLIRKKPYFRREVRVSMVTTYILDILE